MMKTSLTNEKNLDEEDYKITWSDENQSDSENESNEVQQGLKYGTTEKACAYCRRILKSADETTKHEINCEIAKSSKAKRVTCKNGDSKFICQICCRTYKYYKNLIEHEKKHQGEGGFLCRYCDAKFCTLLDLDKHKENSHKVYKCNLCKVILETSESYLEHINSIHNGQDKEYKVCDVCGRQFLHTEHLNYHRITSCGTKSPFICDICGKGFRSKGILKTHTKIHTDDKKFSCSYCGKRFIHKEQLRVHERVHTGEKPYKCDICGKAFAHRESLVTHSTTHTGMKPYLCVCCDARFSCVSSILAHRRTRPDTCGLPQYCTKLAKACPRVSIKLKQPIIDITARATKVIKESDLKKAANKLKRNEIKPVPPITVRQRTSRVRKAKTKASIIENSDDDEPLIKKIKFSSKHMKSTEKSSDDIKIKIELDSEKTEDIEISNNENPINTETLEYFKPKKSMKIKHELSNLYENFSTDNVITKMVEIADTIKMETFQDIEIKPEMENHNLENFEQVLDHPNTLEKHCPNKLILNNDYFDEIKTDPSISNEPNYSDGDCLNEIANFIAVNVTEDDKDQIKFKQIRRRKCAGSQKTSSKFLLNEQIAQNAESSDQAEEKDTNKSYECIECDGSKVYNNRSNFERHLRSKHYKSSDEIKEILQIKNELPSNYACTICSKSYTYSNSLQAHMKLHGTNGTLVMKCKSCVLYFSNKEDLKIHCAESHLNQVKCKICNKIYACETSLKTHLKYKHTEGDDRYKPKNSKFMCNQCGKILSNKTSLNNHEASNCGLDPQWKCQECGKALTTKALLKQHMLIHTGELPFKCSYCAKGFRSKAPMIVHERMHTGEKPFKCPYCEKCFAYRENLLIHISTHNGFKRYCCNCCGERFSCISGLKNHWKTHAQTCGAYPNRSTKATVYIGFRNGELVDKKKVLEL